MIFSLSADFFFHFFFKINFFKIYSQEYYLRVSNSLDRKQAQHSVSVGPDLGINCLQRNIISR